MFEHGLGYVLNDFAMSSLDQLGNLSPQHMHVFVYPEANSDSTSDSKSPAGMADNDLVTNTDTFHDSRSCSPVLDLSASADNSGNVFSEAIGSTPSLSSPILSSIGLEHDHKSDISSTSDLKSSSSGEFSTNASAVASLAAFSSSWLSQPLLGSSSSLSNLSMACETITKALASLPQVPMEPSNHHLSSSPQTTASSSPLALHSQIYSPNQTSPMMAAQEIHHLDDLPLETHTLPVLTLCHNPQAYTDPSSAFFTTASNSSSSSANASPTNFTSNQDNNNNQSASDTSAPVTNENEQPAGRGEKRHRCNFRTTDLDLYLWHVSRLQVPEQRALAEARANAENPEERDEEGRPVYACTAAFAVPNRLLRHQQTMSPSRRPPPAKKKKASFAAAAAAAAARRLFHRCSWPRCGAVFRDDASLSLHMRDIHHVPHLSFSLGSPPSFSPTPNDSWSTLGHHQTDMTEDQYSLRMDSISLPSTPNQGSAEVNDASPNYSSGFNYIPASYGLTLDIPSPQVNSDDIINVFRATVQQRVKTRLPDSLFATLEPALMEWSDRLTDTLSALPQDDDDQSLLSSATEDEASSAAFLSWRLTAQQ